MNLAVNKAELTAAAENDPRWPLLVAHDPAADGKFYYSVKTTGIYCRPSCAARLARAENVRFHSTCDDAERAGFRPCKRCKPSEPSLLEQQAKTVAKICRLIENSEIVPPLEELANQAALSPYHFHRLFKSITGLTPKGYGAAHRATRVRNSLGGSRTVTELFTARDTIRAGAFTRRPIGFWA